LICQSNPRNLWASRWYIFNHFSRKIQIIIHQKWETVRNHLQFNTKRASKSMICSSYLIFHWYSLTVSITIVHNHLNVQRTRISPSTILNDIIKTHSCNFTCKISAIITGNCVLCFHNKNVRTNNKIRNTHCQPNFILKSAIKGWL
jgi:hypothetical protein